MSINNCTTCQKSKPTLHCGICTSKICKKCAQFVDEEMLAYLQRPHNDLLHSAYCQACFDEKISPVKRQYENTLNIARDVSIYYKAQSKETRAYRRKEKPYSVENCMIKSKFLCDSHFLPPKLDSI